MGENARRDSINRLAKVGPNAAARSGGIAGGDQSDAPSILSANAAAPRSGLLSVGEAATRLGTDKARLRVVLSHGQVAHKLVAKRPEQNIPQISGTADAETVVQPSNGRGVRVPAAILDELRSLLESLPHETVPDAQSPVAANTASILPETLGDVLQPTNDENSENRTDGDQSRAEGVAVDSLPVNDVPEIGIVNIQRDQPGIAEEEPDYAQPSVSTPTSMPLSLAFERLLGEKDARIEDLKAEIAHLRDVLEREQVSHARTQALISLQSPPPPQADLDKNTPEAAKTTPISPQPQTKRLGWFQWLRSRSARRNQ